MIPPLAHLNARARALRAVRQFFDARGYLELETPILRATASMEPHLVSFDTTLRQPAAPSRRLYLHTSPEYAMKRALAAFPSQPLFQIATVFRNDEQGPTHNHEFSLIEWYRPLADYRTLMEETEALVRAVLASSHQTYARWNALSIDCKPPFERLTVRDAFAHHLGLDLDALTQTHDLLAAARATGSNPSDNWPWEDIFHLMMLDHIEPKLGTHTPCFLIDYPPRLASLARLRGDIAERFELYIGGLELCNGFSELTDPAEQRARFQAEQHERASRNLEVHALDERLLSALGSLPPCAGNALGFDRLLMLTLGCASISEVRLCDID